MAEIQEGSEVQEVPAGVEATKVDPAEVETATGDPGDTEAGQGLSVWQKIGIVLGVLVIIAAIIAVFYGLMTHPAFTAGLRDVAIIVLAMVTMITSILLAVLLFQLQSLIVLLRDEIQPILKSINQTTGTVRGTATFVSDAVVTPVIQVAGYISGVKTAFKTLFGGSGGQSASSQSVDQETDIVTIEPESPTQVSIELDQQS